jgi:tetratricopeptide (TPR) repeat protein
MRRLPALVAALLLPAATPVLVGTAISAGALLVAHAPAQAQSAEAVAKVAQTITVRIEGATQGSGVLVKRESNRYTVLTAWHVLSGQRPGEELDIYTPDGQRHQLEQGSIKRLGEVDLAVLTFTSSNSYDLARVGDVKSVSMGSPIFVGGFPLPTSAVPSKIFRFKEGRVEANATVAIPNGYQLLYSNPTLPGMSGGAVLNAEAQLVGIHASAERADQISESSGKAVATSTNQGVPIGHYSQYASGAAVVASSAIATSADDYLAKAKALLGKEGSEQEVIRLAGKVLLISQSAEAYFYRAYAKADIGDSVGAIDDYDRVISIDPKDSVAYFNRGLQRHILGDKQGAIIDYNKAISIEPTAKSLNNRCAARREIGDKNGALADCGKAVEINPNYAEAYYNLGSTKFDLGDLSGALALFSKAIAVNSKYAEAYYFRAYAKDELGNADGAIDDLGRAIDINPRFANAYTFRAYVWKKIGNKSKMCADLSMSSRLGDGEARSNYAHLCD